METLPPFAFGPLFEAAQRQAVFPDGKTFVDGVPRRPVAAILADYLACQPRPEGAALRRFVEENFELPPSAHVEVPAGEEVVAHMCTLWRALRREPDPAQPGSSLLPLPFPYIVPGGRFREIYYWDSYFTMLGLRECGEEAMIGHMADNFAHLIARYGFVPNGNRTYYLPRSQPPMLALMVELLAERQGPAAYLRYRPALRREHDYWMDRGPHRGHRVTLPGGAGLNRYYDQLDTPRPESFAEDEALALRAGRPRGPLLRHVRSAAESGWDFSSRWFADGQTIETIRTTELAPVDLNCFLHQLETTLAAAARAAGDEPHAAEMTAAAAQRQEAIQRHCWSEPAGFFGDCEIATGRVTDCLSLAGVVPLFARLATPAQARAVARLVEEKFLGPGGVVTTLRHTGQQWDVPNGWAPLQWLTIRGLENYGEHALAAEIARRWIRLNCAVYARTGKLMEKYNVLDVNLAAGGGEYPSQDGFGWTNGVLLKLINLYGR